MICVMLPQNYCFPTIFYKVPYLGVKEKRKQIRLLNLQFYIAISVGYESPIRIAFAMFHSTVSNSKPDQCSLQATLVSS